MSILSRRTAIAAAFIAAAVAMPGLRGTGEAASHTSGPSAQVKQQAKDGTSTPAPSSARVIPSDLQFLHSLGSPISNPRVLGIPWPGRRAAAARRSAGSTNRMR